MFKIFKKNRLSKSQFLISYILILGIILIIGMALYYATYRQVNSGIHQQNRQALSSAIAEMDDTLELMSAAARQAASNREFNQLSHLTSSADPDFFYQAFAAQTSVLSQ